MKHPKAFSTVDEVTIRNLKNEYESKLIEKDMEIQKLRAVLQSVQNALGVTSAAPVPTNSSNLQMWLDKLGRGGTSSILKFLAERSGMKFTRNQIKLAVGLSSAGTFRAYIGLLKRNNLIIEEGNYIRINPDL